MSRAGGSYSMLTATSPPSGMFAMYSRQVLSRWVVSVLPIVIEGGVMPTHLRDVSEDRTNAELEARTLSWGVGHELSLRQEEAGVSRGRRL